ncbi:MAG: hypothetical protein ACRDK5_00720 [Solirubrobacterales bacterium]
MASTERTEETVNLPTLGQEGDVCAQCGSVLAVDQRYCVNCGLRRADTRVDYKRQLTSNGAQPATDGAAPPAAAPGQWTPIWAIGAIAVLGIMLLLGVLIGDNNEDQQVVAGAAAPTVASTPATTTPTDTTAAAPKAPAAPAEAPGEGNVVKGGTGSTEGVGTADLGALEEAQREGKGKDAGQALPDQVATQGEHAEQDPNGPVGNGSGSTCIGC